MNERNGPYSRPDRLIADAVASLSRQPTLDVSVVIMAFNEEATLAAVVDELDDAFRSTTWAHEILIVDDGSTDGTGLEADRLGRDRGHVRVIHHASNRGIGEVYRSGFSSAHGKFITFLPADGQFPATIVTDFLPLAEEHDLVLGYIPDHRRGIPATILSAAERSFYRLMFGRMPPFQGIMMFSHDLLKRLHVAPSGRGWGVLMEIIVLAQRSGLRITSVPTPLRARQSGRSKVMNLSSVWANLKQATALRWRLRGDGRVVRS